MDVINLYKSCPKELFHSFSDENFKIYDNLPSQDFYPRLNNDGNDFDDLPNNHSLQDRRHPVSGSETFLRYISINKITGIENQINGIKNYMRGTKIRSRELRILFYNKKTQQFIGSTLLFQLENIDHSNEWNFVELGRNDSSFFIKLKQDFIDFYGRQNISVIFECVSLIEQNDLELKVSLGFATLPLNDLINKQSLVLDIRFELGSPFESKNQSFNPRTNERLNEYSRNQVYDPSSYNNNNLNSQNATITLEIKEERNIGEELRSKIEYLPKNCLVHHSSINILKTYREYLRKLQ